MQFIIDGQFKNLTIGDQVVIRSDLLVDYAHHPSIVEGMIKFRGQTATIVSEYMWEDDVECIALDICGYYWTYDMIDTVETEKLNSSVYSVADSTAFTEFLMGDFDK